MSLRWPAFMENKAMTQVVLTEVHGKVGLIRINRPEAMNALNNDVVDGIGAAIDTFEADENIGCIVITGNEKAFAAGADIGFMKDFDYMHAYKTDFITRNWERVKTARKPVIAAVAGFALGGGCSRPCSCRPPPMAARCAPAASSPCASGPARPRARCSSRWRTRPARSTSSSGPRSSSAGATRSCAPGCWPWRACGNARMRRMPAWQYAT